MKFDKLEKLIYQIRNWRAHWRAFYLGSSILLESVLAKAVGMNGRVALSGELSIKLHRENPKWWQSKELDLGIVSRRVVTTAYVNYLRDAMAAGFGAPNLTTFKYHGCGTGVVAESIADTALGVEATTELNPDSTRGVGTQDRSVAKTYSSVSSMSFDQAAAITEHGLFNAAAAGVLLDRSVFAAINADATLGITFTYSLVIADGG